MINNKNERVLILLATFNGESWLCDQVKTILKQKKVNIKILIRDDGSSDSTLNILSHLSNKYQNIEVIFPKKASKVPLKNFFELIISSKLKDYQYIGFSDQDDVWHKNKIYTAISALENKNFGGYSASVTSIWTNGRRKIIDQSDKVRLADFLFEGAGQGCTFLLPSRNFKKIQDFCIKYKKEIKDFYYHDWFVYLLIRSWNETWFFDKNPSMYYRQHQNNDTGSRGTFLSAIKRLEKIKNGWYKKQISIALRIYLLAAFEKNNLISDFSKFFNKKDSIKRRLLMTKFVLLYGRRRFSDRCVLVLASMLGYI